MSIEVSYPVTVQPAASKVSLLITISNSTGSEINGTKYMANSVEGSVPVYFFGNPSTCTLTAQALDSSGNALKESGIPMAISVMSNDNGKYTHTYKGTSNGSGQFSVTLSNTDFGSSSDYVAESNPTNIAIAYANYGDGSIQVQSGYAGLNFYTAIELSPCSEIETSSCSPYSTSGFILFAGESYTIYVYPQVDNVVAPVAGAFVAIYIYRGSTLVYTDTAQTNSSGVASFTYKPSTTGSHTLNVEM